MASQGNAGPIRGTHCRTPCSAVLCPVWPLSWLTLPRAHKYILQALRALALITVQTRFCGLLAAAAWPMRAAPFEIRAAHSNHQSSTSHQAASKTTQAPKYEECLDFARRQDYDAASSSFEKLLAVDPTHEKAWISYAQVCRYASTAGSLPSFRASPGPGARAPIYGTFDSPDSRARRASSNTTGVPNTPLWMLGALRGPHAVPLCALPASIQSGLHFINPNTCLPPARVPSVPRPCLPSTHKHPRTYPEPTR